MGEPVQIGRYLLFDAIASGGMAKVHLGRLSGPLGFSKTVAIKRIHPHLLGEADFYEMFVDETRLAARIQHPNVVSTLDAVVTADDVFLVMELVIGESVSRLVRGARRRQEAVPCAIAVAIACDVLRGLHAAHETKDDIGEPLCVVHRDVSPQNIMVGVDGVARIFDFGVAKARGRLQSTRQGQIKGKLSYMAPEQLRGLEPDRRTDIYAASVVLWEALAGRRLFQGDNDAIVYSSVLTGPVEPPSAMAQGIPPALDDVIMRGLSRDASVRWTTAEEMALALESIVHPASQTAVGTWVGRLAGDAIAARSARIAEIERGQYVAASSPALLAPGSGSMPSSSLATPSSHRLPPSQASRPAPDASEGPDTSASDYVASVRVDAPRKRSWLLPAVLATAGILSLVVMGAAWMVNVRRVASSAGGGSSGSGLPSARSAIASVSTPVELPPPAQTTIQPSSSSDAPPGTASAEHVTRPVASAPPVTHASPASRPPRATCDPPWITDAKGIKRFKPECL